MRLNIKTELMAQLEVDVMEAMKKARTKVTGKPIADAVEVVVTDGVIAGVRAVFSALLKASR